MPSINATSAVLFAAGSVVIALVLCTFLRRHKRGDLAIHWLIASNCAFLLASGGVMFRPVLGFEASAMLVIAGAYSGICCAWFTVLKAEGAAVPLRRVGCIGVAAISGQTWLSISGADVETLMLTSSAINSSLLAFIVWRVWIQIRPYSPRMASLVCLPFVALFVGYAARMPVVLFLPGGEAPLLATVLIIVAMAWATVILELALIALREAQVQVELRAALAKAEAATQARTRFLLGISHEFRTPMNAVLGLSELMRKEVLGRLPEGYLDQANHIHKHAVELNELISDLLLHTAPEQDRNDVDASTHQDLVQAVQDKFAGTPPDREAQTPKFATRS